MWPDHCNFAMVGAPHGRCSFEKFSSPTIRPCGQPHGLVGWGKSPSIATRPCGFLKLPVDAKLIFLDSFLSCMEPRTKKLTQKSSHQVREPSPPPEMEFTIPEHQQRFERLQKLKFGQTCFLDWEALEEIGLVDDIERLLLWEDGIDLFPFVTPSAVILPLSSLFHFLSTILIPILTMMTLFVFELLVSTIVCA